MAPPEDATATVLARLEELADPAFRADLGPRYGIRTPHALGVRMADMKRLAAELGRDHALAAALWATGVYEARTVAALIDDPDLIDAAQMDAWCRDFDTWAIVDSVCFHLFDRTPLAWDAVDRWAAEDGEEDEMVRRAAFALLWGLARHDRTADDDRFRHGLDLIETTSGDGRPLVDKAIDMALRAIARSRPGTTDDARAVATRLAASDDTARRRIGRNALKQIGPATP